MVGGFGEAFGYLFTPGAFGLMMFGTALGIVVGAVPGLTGAMLISLSLPLTFSMSSADAMILLVSMYVGSISGGLITATLLRIPGTPASIMTTFDGYPLAQSGQPGRALGLGISASFVGGMISTAFLILFTRPMANWSVKLGPFDYFSLVLMALVLIASVSGRSMLNGCLSGVLGMLATMPGVSPATGQPRLTFGFTELNDGFKLLPVLIGLFAVGQVLRDIIEIDAEPSPHTSLPASRGVKPPGSRGVRDIRKGLFMTLSDWKSQTVNLVRSSLIGTWIGILPGIGANVGSVAAYSAARSFSKTPERFGRGSEEAIVASEAANNATIGGALIPLIAMGIPGSVIDAILLGALIIHGLQPGPLLFRDNPEIVYTIMAAVLLANCFMFALMLTTTGWLARLVDVPRAYLIPVILVFCVAGSYALSNRMFDVWVMLAFGVIGFGMEKVGVPLAPFVIGFVLAPMAEQNLSAGLMASGGSYWPIVTRPVSLTFFLVSLILLLWPMIKRWREWRREEASLTTDDS